MIDSILYPESKLLGWVSNPVLDNLVNLPGQPTIWWQLQLSDSVRIYSHIIAFAK